DHGRLAITPELEKELPPTEELEINIEKTERLITAWQNRPRPEELLKRYEQAGRVPAPQKSHPIIYGSFEALGNGILNPTRAHRTGRVSEVQWAYDHSQSLTTMYLGGTNGGLWKYSMNLGGIWMPISDSLDGSPAVGAFWVAPSASLHLLIGTGDPWRNGGSGLYESHDGGLTWTQENIGGLVPGSFYKIASDRSDPSNILAASRDGLFRSTDGGGSWTRIITTEVTDVVQDPVYHQYWYAAGPNIGIHESDDRGASFHTFATGFPSGVSRVSLAVCDSAPNYVYASASNASDIRTMKGIYRSSNYGYNWQAIKTTDDLSWGQAFHTTAIAVSPVDPNILLVGMGGFQMNLNATRSSAPNSWIVGIEIGHADCTSFAFTADGRYALASNDGGVYSFDIQNRTWVDHLNLIPDLNLQEVVADGFGTPKGSFHSARDSSWLSIAGLQDNGVVKIDDDLDEVTFLTGGDGGEVHISNHDTFDLLGTVGGPPFFRRQSTDMGATWSAVDCNLSSQPGPYTILEDPVWRWPHRSFTHQGDRVYSSLLWYRCSWVAVNSTPFPAGFNSRHLEMGTRQNAPVFYVNGTGTASNGTPWGGELLVLDGTVHGSIGQMGWANRTPPLPPGSTRIDSKVTADRFDSRPDTVYYTTGRSRPSRAYVSNDRGQTWNDVTGNLTTLLPDADYWEVVALPSDANTLFLATDVGVFATTDGGVNWVRMTHILPRVLYVTDVEVRKSTVGRGELLIATKGRGFYRSTIY
ncbi:MAG: hypothetical protein MI919_14670, partial [Holophagales bacterium]|nr:hypothetical protein [Holophagales bacterium]